MSLYTKKHKHRSDENPIPDEQPAQPASVGAESAPEPDATAAAAAASGTTDQPDGLQPRLAPESSELASLKDRYARLLADFDNYRKRQARDREELVKRANSDLLRDLLPVLDHLELALAKAADPADPFVTGVRLVYDQLLAILNNYEMRPLDTAGEPFDPAFHEALSQMPSETVPAHVVIEQFRRGWLLAGRLMRPAQVIVSSGLPKTAPADAANEADGQPDA